jgi:hypothetical protein
MQLKHTKVIAPSSKTILDGESGLVTGSWGSTVQPPTQQVDALDQPPDAVIIMLTHDFTTSV